MNAYRVRGWHVFAAMLAFFGVVIAVNATFIVFAVGSFPGEDVRRSYLQGLHYNETLAERRAQDALGWHASAIFAGGVEGASVEVSLREADGTPIDGAQIEGTLERPTVASFDQTLQFAPAGGGRYVARTGALEPGRWRLRARAGRGDDARDFEAELTWQP